MKNIKKELKKLKAKYKKEKIEIIKKCPHNWKYDGYTSNKWDGTMWYKCSICKKVKGTGF